jgi:ribosomal protein S18 acetylase RimI-like enzyme
MKEYVEKVWGWDEAWQKTYCLQHFDPEALQIVVLDCTDIGCISVADRDRELFLRSIEIMPEYQNKGIGTFLIKEIILHAQRENKPVALQVLKTNTRARILYQRLGFSDCGETETHYRMTYG